MAEIYNQEKGVTLKIDKGNPLTTFIVFQDVVINNILKKQVAISGQVDGKGNINFKTYNTLSSSEYFDSFSVILKWVSDELKK